MVHRLDVNGSAGNGLPLSCVVSDIFTIILCPAPTARYFGKHGRGPKGEAFLQNRQLSQGLADQGGHEFFGHGGGDGTLGCYRRHAGRRRSKP